MNAALELGVEMLPMAAQDLDEVLRIEYAVYSHPWSRSNFSDSMASGYRCWVCRLGVNLVGYFVLMIAVDEVHLLNISVAEGYQEQGLGARLMRFAMLDAARNGGKTFLLEVRPSNEKALALYHHLGFRQIGVRRGYYPAEGGREDALVMVRELCEEVCA